MLVHALRQALCPAPGLLALINAANRGEIGPPERRRKRVAQPMLMLELLKGWILG